MSESKIDQDTDSSLEMLFSALTAEYESTRETSRSRDQLLGSLMNFMMIVFSAAILGLPTIISNREYWILLLISIVLTGLTMHYLWQGRIIQELARSEDNVLRPKLDSLFKTVGYAKNVPTEIYQLWQWQSYFIKREARGTFLSRFARKLSRHGGMPSLSTLGSIGFLLLFLYYREIQTLTSVELVFLLLASVFALALLVAIISGSTQIRGVTTFS